MGHSRKEHKGCDRDGLYLSIESVGLSRKGGSHNEREHALRVRASTGAEIGSLFLTFFGSHQSEYLVHISPRVPGLASVPVSEEGRRTSIDCTGQL